MICKQCGAVLAPNRKKYCSRKCGNNWRQQNVYGDKFKNEYRSQSPRNFMMCLVNKRKGREHLTVDFLVELYEKQEGKCALSGKIMTYVAGEGRVPTNISLDRIDSNVGYEEGNIQLTCVQANKMKAELTEVDLAEWCESILNTRNHK